MKMKNWLSKSDCRNLTMMRAVRLMTQILHQAAVKHLLEGQE